MDQEPSATPGADSDRERREALDALRRAIAVGVKQADEGLTRPLDVERIKREARRRRRSRDSRTPGEEKEDRR